jgi:uncharacterized membrane protein YjfL (UPF0719 family)
LEKFRFVNVTSGKLVMWALIKFSSAIEHQQTMFFVDTQAKATVVVLLVVYQYVSVTLLVRIHKGNRGLKDEVKVNHSSVNIETTSVGDTVVFL